MSDREFIRLGTTPGLWDESFEQKEGRPQVGVEEKAGGLNKGRLQGFSLKYITRRQPQGFASPTRGRRQGNDQTRLRRNE